MRRVDMIGRAYGSWTVEALGKRSPLLRCRCSCGRIKQVSAHNLLRGRSTQCRGCATTQAKTRHGWSRTCTHRAWMDIKRKADCPPRWSSFEAFLADVGPRPTDQHVLSCLDPDGSWAPSNAVWLTRSEHQRRQWQRRSAPLRRHGGPGPVQLRALNLLRSSGELRPTHLAILIGRGYADPSSSGSSLLRGLQRHGLAEPCGDGRWRATMGRAA